MPQFSKMGLTRSRANAMNGAGLKFHAYTPIGLQRPTLENVEYRAAPIAEEGVTLYSFGSHAEMEKFIETYASQGAVEL